MAACSGFILAGISGQAGVHLVGAAALHSKPVSVESLKPINRNITWVALRFTLVPARKDSAVQDSVLGSPITYFQALPNHEDLNSFSLRRRYPG